MDRIRVDSTTLTWVGYSDDQGLLELGFHDGKVYDYFEVPLYIYQDLLRAASKGRYFNLHIRDHFRAQSAGTLTSGAQN